MVIERLKNSTRNLWHNISARPDPLNFTGFEADETGKPIFWGEPLTTKRIERILKGGLEYTTPLEKLKDVLFTPEDGLEIKQGLDGILRRMPVDKDGNVKVHLPPIKPVIMTPNGPMAVSLYGARKVGLGASANIIGNLISMYNTSQDQNSPSTSDQLLNQIPQLGTALFGTSVREQINKLYTLGGPDSQLGLSLQIADTLGRAPAQGLSFLSSIVEGAELIRKRDSARRGGQSFDQNGIEKISKTLGTLSGVANILASLWCSYEAMSGERVLKENFAQQYLSANQEPLLTAATYIRSMVTRDPNSMEQYRSWVRNRIREESTPVYDTAESTFQPMQLYRDQDGTIYTTFIVDSTIPAIISEQLQLNDDQQVSIKISREDGTEGMIKRHPKYRREAVIVPMPTNAQKLEMQANKEDILDRLYQIAGLNEDYVWKVVRNIEPSVVTEVQRATSIYDAVQTIVEYIERGVEENDRPMLEKISTALGIQYDAFTSFARTSSAYENVTRDYVLRRLLDSK